MCGFAGFYDPGRRWSETEMLQISERMSQRIAHRGPDDASTWRSANGDCMLSFRRLAILDLSEAGRQPMHSPDRRWSIVFNGEIYNYQALKQEVESSGKYPFSFRGHSDTEVLLAAIHVWGIQEALKRTNGMLALAAWDAKRKSLFLARDRFGEKPLYYTLRNGTAIFGSEIKALQGYPGIQFEVDESSLHSYFRFGYFPTPYTVYKEVRKLTPGCYLELRDGKAPQETPYWDPGQQILHARMRPYLGSLLKAVEELDSLLSESVRLRMVADVPLGAFLSGGIDSSLIVAEMQRQSRRPVQTFCIGFEEESYNESPYAKKVAQHLGTDHTDWILKVDEAQKLVPSLGDIYDEPLADASQIPTLLVSRLARKKVTVALSGDAGDELFGGYDRYRWADSVQRTVGQSPEWIRRSLGTLLGRVPQPLVENTYNKIQEMLPEDYRWNNPGEKIQKLAAVLSTNEADEIHRALVSQWGNPHELISQGTERAPENRVKAIPAELRDLVSRMMYLDLVTYLTDDVLVKVDRASMYCGLEVRVPFLDPKVVHFLWSLPPEWKLSQGKTKVIVRELLMRHFPEAFFNRPKKGFSLPVDIWLRTGLREWAESLLSDSALAASGQLRIPVVQRYWKEHLSGRQNHQHKLWSVLQFQNWWFAQKRS